MEDVEKSCIILDDSVLQTEMVCGREMSVIALT